jgi:hypothetical protein
MLPKCLLCCGELKEYLTPSFCREKRDCRCNSTILVFDEVWSRGAKDDADFEAVFTVRINASCSNTHGAVHRFWRQPYKVAGRQTVTAIHIFRVVLLARRLWSACRSQIKVNGGLFVVAILIAILIAFHAGETPGTKVITKFALKSILESFVLHESERVSLTPPVSRS